MLWNFWNFSFLTQYITHIFFSSSHLCLTLFVKLLKSRRSSRSRKHFHCFIDLRTWLKLSFNLRWLKLDKLNQLIIKKNENMTTSNFFDAKLDKSLAFENIDSIFDSKKWFVVENNFEVSWMISRFEAMRRCSKDLMRDNVELSNVSFRRLIAFLSKIDDIENEKTITNRMSLSIKFIVDSKSKNESSLKSLNF